MITQKSLTAEAVHEKVSDLLKEYSGLTVSGYRCNREMVIDVLVKAAIEGRSIESISASLVQVTDSNTLREQLDRAFEVSELRRQEVAMNAGLAASVPSHLPRQQVTIAVDMHDESFYGKTPLLLAYTCGGQARKGNSHFFRIASAYLVWRSVRVTLAVTYVLPEDTTVAMVQRVWERLTQLGFKHTTWYLDKGFCSGEVLRFFQAHH